MKKKISVLSELQRTNLENFGKALLFIIIAVLTFLLVKVDVNADVIEVDPDNMVFEYLHELEYDAVVATDYTYAIIVKQESGFDVNATKYALVNLDEKKTLMEYTELPEAFDKDEYGYINFVSNGGGVFSYFYLDGEGTNGDVVFLSADKGSYFIQKLGNSPEEIYFANKQAVVLLRDDENSNSYSLGFLDSNGELSDLKAEGYDKKTLKGYWLYDSDNYGWDYENDQWYSDAYMYINKKEELKLLVYNRNENKIICITDQTYLSRFDENTAVYIGTGDDLPSGYIYLDGMSGDDGNKYAALFDQNGSISVPAFVLPDDDFKEYCQEYPEDYFDAEIDEDLLGSWYWEGDEDEGESPATLTFDSDYTYTVEQDGEISTVNDIWTNAEMHLLYITDGDPYLNYYFIVNDKLIFNGITLTRAE